MLDRPFGSARPQDRLGPGICDTVGLDLIRRIRLGSGYDGESNLLEIDEGRDVACISEEEEELRR
jgi:hypothetical protein